MIERPDSAYSILVEIDTLSLSERQKERRALILEYISTVFSAPIDLSSADLRRAITAFDGDCSNDEVKSLIIKSEIAKKQGNPVSCLELLKDAEFLASQLDDKLDLGFIYLYLSKVYVNGFNGTVSEHYANKSLKLFNELHHRKQSIDARMAIVGAMVVKTDYKRALDSMLLLKDDVIAYSTESYKLYFLDQLARSLDVNGRSQDAIDIWLRIFNDISPNSNTLAHWAQAYIHTNKLDSAEILIDTAIALPHNYSDEYLCRNVEYTILEKMGRVQELERIDSLRTIALNNTMSERHLEESSLALNIKYDSATRHAWLEASEARNRTYITLFIALLTGVAAVATYIFMKKRNRLLQLEHENDILRMDRLQYNLFKSDSWNNDMSAKISELFKTRFNLIDGLAATYFECKDTSQEQKRIYSEVKNALSNFGTKEAIDDLTRIVNGYKENLMNHFKTDFPKMSPAQYKIALYLFCGFSLPAISIFTDTEIRNLYVYKSRLKSAISKSNTPRKTEYLQYFG